MQDKKRGIHLYVKRVFITDNCEALLPDYLRFIRGVVDSEDLSLNVSRELLQQNRQIQRMRKGLVGKILDTLKQMHDQETETYARFWSEFGRVLKEGLFQDSENREKLLGLIRCPSTHSPSELTSELSESPTGNRVAAVDGCVVAGEKVSRKSPSVITSPACRWCSATRV